MANRVDAAVAPWTKHYPESVPPGLTGSFSTMLSAWDEHVRTRPQDPAVHYFDTTLTFAEIDRTADALAVALRSHGLTAGERVAIYLQNDPQWLVSLLAAWKLRAVPVAVNPMLRAKELLHILTDSGAAALICLDDLYESVVADVRDHTALHTVVATHPLDMTPNATLPTAIESHVPPRKTFADTLDWQSLMSEYHDRHPTPAESGSSDIASLTYTSGTTGRSKGAMNLHSAMVHSSTVYTKWWDLQPGRDVIIGLAPVFHITGLVAGFGVHIISGAPLVLLHRFDAETALRAIERRRGIYRLDKSSRPRRSRRLLLDEDTLRRRGSQPGTRGSDPRHLGMDIAWRLRHDRDDVSDTPGTSRYRSPDRPRERRPVGGSSRSRRADPDRRSGRRPRSVPRRSRRNRRGRTNGGAGVLATAGRIRPRDP
jgi:long-chain acyl-CoA synthetase